MSQDFMDLILHYAVEIVAFALALVLVVVALGIIFWVVAILIGGPIVVFAQIRAALSRHPSLERFVFFAVVAALVGGTLWVMR
jgi:hypothetical protein